MQMSTIDGQSQLQGKRDVGREGSFPTQKFQIKLPYISEVCRIRFTGLESGRIQHILNKPDRTRPTVLFKFPDQDFQISFDATTIIKRIFAKM